MLNLGRQAFETHTESLNFCECATVKTEAFTGFLGRVLNTVDPYLRIMGLWRALGLTVP